MYFICLVFPRPDCFQKILQLMTMRIAHEVTYLNSPPPLWSTIWIQTKKIYYSHTSNYLKSVSSWLHICRTIKYAFRKCKYVWEKTAIIPWWKVRKIIDAQRFFNLFTFMIVLFTFFTISCIPIYVFYIVPLFHFYSTAWCFSWKDLHDRSSHTISFIFFIFLMSLHNYLLFLFLILVVEN